MPLDHAANELLENFGQKLLDRSREVSGSFASALGKARGHALRLAGILEHIRWATHPGTPEPATISIESMEIAIEMMHDFFLPMAERVFGDAIAPAAERGAHRLAVHLCAERLERFNARELRLALGGSLRKSEDMDAACSALEEAGAIRPIEKTSGTKGRAPKLFSVNPSLHGRGK